MSVLVIALGILLLLMIGIWFYGFFVANDFTVPTKIDVHFKRALFIYPHPDDEVGTAGALIARLADAGTKVTLVFLTKGEKGTPDAHLDSHLKVIRTSEAKKSAQILGVQALIQADFGDGELIHKKAELKQYVEKLIDTLKPELVVTYDLAGLYGHEDHITVSEVVTELIHSNYPQAHLWYASFPARVLALMSLPVHMAKDPNFIAKRALPTHKVFTGKYLSNRLRAVYAHQSQLATGKNAFPIKLLPYWFYHSMQVFEYYSKAH